MAHLNYNARQPVEGESFRAWGELWYLHPLTEKQMADYELRPAHDNPVGREPVPERGAAKKPPIARQMKEAGRKAREHRPRMRRKRKAPAGATDRRTALWRKNGNRNLPTRRLCGLYREFHAPIPKRPPEREKPLDKVKEPPRASRSLEREER